MLARIVTCAASVFALVFALVFTWPAYSAEEGPFRLAAAAAAGDPRSPATDFIRNTDTAEPKATAQPKAAQSQPPLSTPDRAAVESLPASTKTALSAESEPFGLAAKSISAAAIVAKWQAVEAEIAAENQILARCRNESRCPPAARRLLAIVDEGRAQKRLGPDWRYQPRDQSGNRIDERLEAMGDRRPLERAT
jgi:hypothetical protein